MKMGVEGYGIYFMILEMLRDEPDYTSIKDYNMLAFDFRVSADKVKLVVEDFGLFSFTEDGKRFYSESFLRRMQQKDDKSEKARISANARWKKCERNANASENDAIKVKESKEEYKEEEIITPKGVIKEEEKTTTTPRFKKPTIEEIDSYLKEKKITGFTAEKFHAYYESKGWYVGNTPMKNWKAAVTTWKANNGNNGYSSGGKPAANIGLSKPLSKNYDVTRTSL